MVLAVWIATSSALPFAVLKPQIQVHLGVPDQPSYAYPVRAEPLLSPVRKGQYTDRAFLSTEVNACRSGIQQRRDRLDRVRVVSVGHEGSCEVSAEAERSRTNLPYPRDHFFRVQVLRLDSKNVVRNLTQDLL